MLFLLSYTDYIPKMLCFLALERFDLNFIVLKFKKGSVFTYYFDLFVLNITLSKYLPSQVMHFWRAILNFDNDRF